MAFGTKKQNMTKLTLRALEPEDIDAIYRWENDPRVWVSGVAHQPFSRDALQRYILESSTLDIYAARQLRLMAVDEKGCAVGCVDLFDFDPFHRRAGVGILVDAALRGQGYGKAMLEAVELFTKEHLNMHQLYCDIAEDNEHSINLFSHCGYQHCGTRHSWVWNVDRWLDALIFQKIIEN